MPHRWIIYHPAMPRTGRSVLAAVGIAALAALPHLNALGNGFTYDDVPLVAENPRIRSISPSGLLGSDWWGGARPQSLLYRPLAMTTFAIDHAIAAPPAGVRLPDAAARPFHVQNILWHAAASVAFLFLVQVLFGSPVLAAAAAALFAVHPVHTEAVDGIVGRAELISACFAFVALGLAAKAERPVGAALALFAALLAKEQAITVPLVAAAWLYGYARSDRRAGARRMLVALGIAAVAYLVLRGAVLGAAIGTTHASGLDVDNPVASATGAARVLTPLRVFAEVVGLLVFPRTLSADYSFDQIPVISSIDLATAAGLVALTAAVAAAIVLRRRLPEASFGLVLFLLTWLLTSNLLVPIGTILGERLLYLPSAGVCLAAAGLALEAGRRLRVRWAGTAIVALAVVAGAGRSWARNGDWKDNLTLFEVTTRTSPRSCKAADGYAAELYARGRTREALRWAQRSFEIAPGYLEAHRTMSKILRVLAAAESDEAERIALREQARRHAETVLAAAGPGTAVRADALGVRGALFLDEGRFEDAERAFREALVSHPADVASLEGLGVVLVGRARAESEPARRVRLLQEALASLEQAIAADPGHAETLQNAASALRDLAALRSDASLLRRADAYEARAVALSGSRPDPAAAANLHGVRGQRLLAEGKPADALGEFREAARLTPDAARAYLGIGTALAAQSEAETDPVRREALVTEALAAYDEALHREPGNADAHLNVGILLLRSRRDPARAAQELRTYLRLVPETPLRGQLEQTLRTLP